jgi:hypothetical protein
MSLPLENKQEDSQINSKTDKSESTDHTLDEYTFDIDLQKSCLDSYFHKKENENKKLKVKNYSVTNAEYCKNLVNGIEKEIIYNSESTSEAKIINLQEELNFIKKEKAKTNSIINENPEMAIENYSKILAEIDRIFLTVQDHIIQDPVINDIGNEKKLIMSNLALAYTKRGRWKESTQIDEEIIKIDNKFIKSYARLVRSHVSLENFHQAQTYANYLRSNFSKEAMAQYADILEDFDKKHQAFEEKVNIYLYNYFYFNYLKSLKNLARKNKKKEVELKKEIEESKIKKQETNMSAQQNLSPESKKLPQEEIKTQVAKKHKNWLSALFGGLVFVSSSAGLFFLYKFRKNFTL